MVSSETIGIVIVTYLAGVLSGAFGKMIADWFADYRRRLKMHVDVDVFPVSRTTVKSESTVGFGISIEQGKELSDAYPICNGLRYSWFENGKYLNTAELYVGENPHWFYPYFVTLDYVDDLSKHPTASTDRWMGAQPSNHGILVTVREFSTKNTVFSQIISMPADLPSLKLSMKRELFKISIKLIGKGVERKMKFEGTMYLTKMNIGKLDNGVPSMGTVDSEFMVEVPAEIFG
jgi:hypothetical protein